MKIKQLSVTLFLIGLSFAAAAQDYNPYKSIGKKAKILTLSKGKYVEFFDYDTIQRIGTVMYNIRSKKIVRLLNVDSIYKKASNNTSTSRWYSPDPLSEKFASYSPYNFVENNPISKVDPTGASTESVHIDDKGKVLRNYNDGDNSVYVHKAGTTATDVDKAYVNTMAASKLKNTSGGGTKIGELGKAIDGSTIFKNFLNANINTASGIVNPLTFRNLVKGHGEWDLKNNNGTIYGLAHSFDKGKTTQTQFAFGGKNYTSEDLGNYNYGATGMAVWCLSAQTLLEQAGAAQMAAGTSKPEWQQYGTREVGAGHGETRTVRGAMLPPYGDDPQDQEMIKAGIIYYQTNKFKKVKKLFTIFAVITSMCSCTLFEKDEKLLVEHQQSTGGKIMVYYVSSGATTNDVIQVRKPNQDKPLWVSDKYNYLENSKLINDTSLQLVLSDTGYQNYNNKRDTIFVNIK